MSAVPKPKSLSARQRAAAREAANLAHAYGSIDHLTFVKCLPCAACGRTNGYQVNAHLLGNGGVSKKGHYTTVGPLCPACHLLYDEHRWDFDARFPTFNPQMVASHTEDLWRKHNGEE